QVYTDWALNMLIDWHNADPVSQKEIDRNDIIYADVQHNRNPFIDHPEYVSYIWGGAPPVPAVNFATVSQQVEESAGSLSITLSISQAATEDVTANLILTGTALNGSDYTLSQNYVVFPASSTTGQSVTLTITDDSEPEDFESVIITIDTLITQDPDAVIGNNDQITVTINNSDGFDETPPEIFSHELINDSTLIITYTEKVDPVTSQTVSNYSVDNGAGNPGAVSLGYLGDSAKVELSFPVFSTGVNYTMTVNNVEDLKNNVITTNTTFSFAISTGGEGWVEDFELANWGSYSSGTFALTTGNWDIVDVYPETSAAYAYEGSHAVRMNDDSPGSSVTSPAVNGVDSVIFYFRALNQEASTSTFWLQKSVNGGAYTNVQSQTYQNSTYSQFACKVNDTSNNIRLRVLNDDQPGHLIVDYFKVVTFSGPEQDTVPPDILSHEINGSDIILTFSENLDPATSQTITNYVLDNGGSNPDTAALGYGGDSSKVVVSYPSFLQDVSYTLTINNVEDIAGNHVASNSTVQFLISSGGGSGEGWVEDFELANWGSYSSGTFALTTGNWDIVDVYPETSAAYAYEGSHAVRMNDDSPGSSVTSPAVNGVDSVIFYFRALNQEASVSTFWLQKSVGGGAYTNVQSQTFQNSTYSQFACKVNDASDNIRLRVLNDDQSGHLIIDNFAVVQFPAAQPPSAPDNVSTAISGTDITITWDAVSGASGYDVYSSDLPYTGFGWEAAVTTPEYSTSCTEANKFYYIVASTTAKALNPGESHERFIEIRKKSK
ncbi:MAG: endonuclease, partial [Candidatus Delongbacteria bacterium]|nr:endonuclease [Candidatus Delongbacteria bacterium]